MCVCFVGCVCVCLCVSVCVSVCFAVSHPREMCKFNSRSLESVAQNGGQHGTEREPLSEKSNAVGPVCLVRFQLIVARMLCVCVSLFRSLAM